MGRNAGKHGFVRREEAVTGQKTAFFMFFFHAEAFNGGKAVSRLTLWVLRTQVCLHGKCFSRGRLENFI